MKTIIKYIIIVCIVCVGMMQQPVLAADDCGDLPPCYYEDDVPFETCCPVEVPFDGGITLMLAAGGIGMGVRAIRKRKTA